MKRILFLILFANISMLGQNLHHQMLSSQGVSKELPNGMYVSQTIGQQSIVGNTTKNGVTYSQGYQQSVWNKYISNNSVNSITTVTYPNPFTGTVNFQFSQPILENISIALYDVLGRLVYSATKKSAENILIIDLSNLASGDYLVRLTSAHYTYYTQILKQE